MFFSRPIIPQIPAVLGYCPLKTSSNKVWNLFKRVRCISDPGEEPRGLKTVALHSLRAKGLELCGISRF